MSSESMSNPSLAPRPLGLSALSLWAPALAAAALVLALFGDTFASMVAIWWRSDTYTHAFLVPPIALWLIWRQRDRLDLSAARPALVWLVPMSAAGVLWLLGHLAGVAAATHLAVVALLVMVVPAVLGHAVARQLAFPLSFLLFAVPVGDFLVEPMMQGTADFTVQALRLSGIPVYREGLQFVIPTGNWSVVEACSGVRYLIASFMVGTLFAYLNFRSLAGRLVFMAVSLAVPVVANWLRAYLIVLLGHVSGNKLAAGADHLIYGWVFFGVVIFIMFAIGARFASREPEVAAPSTAAKLAAAGARNDRRAPWLSTLAVAALLVAFNIVAWRLDQPASSTPQLALPDRLQGDWALADPNLTTWAPRFDKPSVVATGTYRRGDAAVGVWLGHYRNQGAERKLITSTNVLVPGGSAEWLPIAAPAQSVRLAGSDSTIILRATLLRTPADPKVEPRQRLRVLQTYRIGGTFVGSDAQGKIRLALQRLAGRGDDGTVLLLYAEVDESAAGAALLEDFAAKNLPALAAAADQAARR
ncbi:MAG: exosortase A [Burkholderiaceae bacterium]|nr:exosortase A [Burkholderiaceae bacterium]